MLDRTRQSAKAKTAASKAQAGGVFRVEWESSFDFTDGFDPTGEYLGEAFGIYSNLLVRTLVGYNHVAGAAGNSHRARPGHQHRRVTNGGKTYTFHLKSGIKFGPPLNREITSKDVLWAFERIGTKSVNAQYGFYYDAIKGMTAFKDGKSKVIAGIKTPDPKTIIFTPDQAHGRLPPTGSACRPPARSRRKSRDASRSRTSTAATSSPRART